MQTLMRNWWLLALAGVFDAAYALTNLLTLNPDGSLSLRRFLPVATVVEMSVFALAAGVCTIAAGVASSRKGKSWLVALNGLALSAFGLLFFVWPIHKPLSFRPVSLLFVAMALSIGVFGLAGARGLRRHVAEERLLGAAGAISVVCAVVFFGVGFRWIRLPGPFTFLYWMSGYFGFSAVCLLGLGLRLNRLRAAVHRIAH